MIGSWLQFDLCPICSNPVHRDFGCDDPNVVYMDGWHHRDCLDEYLYGPEEQLPREPE